MSPAMPDLGRQLGHIQGQLGSLIALIQERKRDADKQHDETQAEIRNVKHDQRNLEQKIETVADRVMKVELVSGQTARTVTELKRPVDELIRLRSRAMGAVLVLSAIGGIVGWFMGPISRWVEAHFTP